MTGKENRLIGTRTSNSWRIQKTMTSWKAHFPSVETKSMAKMKASINSLSSNVAKHHHAQKLKKRRLDVAHVIPQTAEFPALNLSNLYDRCELFGDTNVVQLTIIYQKLLKTALQPNHMIWLYSHRYRTNKQVDGNFRALPDIVTNGLIDFGLDASKAYLPEDLLFGPFDTNHPFLETIPLEDREQEVCRRRAYRETINPEVHFAIAQSLRNLRTHHLDVESGELVPCTVSTSFRMENCDDRFQGRLNCVDHIRWDAAKRYRKSCRFKRINDDISDAHMLWGKLSEECVEQREAEFKEELDAEGQSPSNDYINHIFQNGED
ncbi:unnamed protein product [Caenorhabditis sp. 36 PRJEB53466]|nr:unnamed protein product [Caenorhabditis sp. 36 PRJEB53466]